MNVKSIKTLSIYFSAILLLVFVVSLVLSFIYTTTPGLIRNEKYEEVTNITIYRSSGERAEGVYDGEYEFDLDPAHSSIYDCYLDLSACSFYDDPAISISTSHIAYDIYQDNLLIHQYKNNKNNYTGGVRIVPIKLNDNYRESTILVRCYTKPYDIYSSIRNIYVGSWMSLLIGQAAPDFISFAVGFSILILSIVWLIISFSFTVNEGKNSLLSFSYILLSLGLWIITQSKTKCLFSTNVAWPLDISYLAIFLLPSSICFYIDSNFKSDFKSFYKFFNISSICFLIFGLVSYAAFIFFGFDHEKYCLTIAGIFELLFILAILIISLFKKEKHFTLIIGLISILIGVGLEEFLHIFGILLNDAGIIYLSMYVATISLLLHSIGECSKNSSRITSNRKYIIDRVYRDSLTNLENRRSLSLKLDSINLYTDKSYALAISDIDNFKKYNDEYGHFKGDEVLISYAKMLTNFCNINAGNCYRVGGDEFVVLFPFKEGTSIDQIEHRLTEATSSISSSFGVGIFLNGFTKDIKDTLQRAEYRMYINKENKKGSSNTV